MFRAASVLEVAILLAAVVCRRGGGGAGSARAPRPLMATAADFWVGSTGSARTLDGFDGRSSTSVTDRDRVTLGDPAIGAGRMPARFDASRPLNKTGGPQYRSCDGVAGIRIWLDALAAAGQAARVFPF